MKGSRDATERRSETIVESAALCCESGPRIPEDERESEFVADPPCWSAELFACRHSANPISKPERAVFSKLEKRIPVAERGTRFEIA